MSVPVSTGSVSGNLAYFVLSPPVVLHVAELASHHASSVRSAALVAVSANKSAKRCDHVVILFPVKFVVKCAECTVSHAARVTASAPTVDCRAAGPVDSVVVVAVVDLNFIDPRLSLTPTSRNICSAPVIGT